MIKSMVGMVLLVLVLTACGTQATEEGAQVATTTSAPEATTQEKEAEEATEGADAEGTQEERPPSIDFTLEDWQGNTVSLSDYRGKIVFLNFFATWCPPCQEEMPEFEQAYVDYEGDVVFLIVDVFTSERTDLAGVKQWWEDGGYTMPMIIDEEGALQGDYPVRAFPTTFVIDREGDVVGYVEGRINRAMVEQVIAQAEK